MIQKIFGVYMVEMHIGLMIKQNVYMKWDIHRLIMELDQYLKYNNVYDRVKVN